MGQDKTKHEEKDKDVETTTHEEGEYSRQDDKPTMSPGSAEAEINPSAKDHE